MTDDDTAIIDDAGGAEPFAEWPEPDRTLLPRTTVHEETAIAGPPPPPRPRRLGLALLVLALLCAALVPAAIAVRSGSSPVGVDEAEASAEAPQRVSVPKVVGTQVIPAQKRLERLGLEVEIERRADRKKKGTVLAQRPQADAEVERGGTVRLVVSAGPPAVRMPRVVSLELAEARKALHEAGLKVQVAGQRSEQPEGTVLGQAPKAGTEIFEGDRVRLVVASGPPPVAMPRVVGQRVADAIAALRASGLEPELAQQRADDVPAGTIVGQNPTAGTKLERGDRVKVVVSTRPAPVAAPQPVQTQPAPQPKPAQPKPAQPKPAQPEQAPGAAIALPDLRGEREDDARVELEAYGLVVEVVTARGKKGVVLEQSPQPGAKVRAGDTVTLTIGG
ncbi:MAG TPA: PASTA domain-containing protein [Gaiellaceae bacterium]|nr:PASTA domain-containing protein [Gaiellaceae bacterium]